MFIGKAEGWKEIYPRLPGRKTLVRGNHDKHSNSWYMNNGFDFSCDAMLFRNIWFTHKPADFLPDGAELNIHGHLHNIWHGFHKQSSLDSPEHLTWQTQRLANDWQRLFAVEYTNYNLVELNKFISNPNKYKATGPSNDKRYDGYCPR